jgi:hypothetical protein
VGIDSKEIHATVSGTVHYAGWENASNPKQGFGQFVCIRSADNKYYYYGHMSVIKVKTGDKVKCTYEETDIPIEHIEPPEEVNIEEVMANRFIPNQFKPMINNER